jgi:peptidoglycan-associated lipoprotein
MRKYLLSHPLAKIILEGNTDPRGSREYNIGLGERRAKAVANIMLAKGVNPKQIRIVSYGAEKLAVPGHNEADYQLDRRVELVYLSR